MADEVVLKRIESKLAALLAIQLDQYLRETGAARPKSRSIDRLLSDAGLTAREIATLLGKTERAVHMVLAGDRTKASQPRKAKQAGKD